MSTVASIRKMCDTDDLNMQHAWSTAAVEDIAGSLLVKLRLHEPHSLRLPPGPHLMRAPPPPPTPMTYDVCAIPTRSSTASPNPRSQLQSPDSECVLGWHEYLHVVGEEVSVRELPSTPYKMKEASSPSRQRLPPSSSPQASIAESDAASHHTDAASLPTEDFEQSVPREIVAGSFIPCGDPTHDGDRPMVKTTFRGVLEMVLECVVGEDVWTHKIPEHELTTDTQQDTDELTSTH